MWAQYANGHAGVCLVFDKLKLQSNLQTQIKNIFSGPIVYRNESISLSNDNPFIIDFDKLLLMGSDKYFKEHIIRHNKALFFLKSSDWSQEREWRFVLQEENQGDQLVNYGDSLEGIILGWQMTEHAANKVLEATSTLNLQIAKLNWRNGFPQPMPLNLRWN